jgi:hypothetical protein
MLIDSVIIKLTRNGVGISPSYSLTIYGHGSLEYNENVNITDKVEEKISKDQIILLLSEFRDSGFFSFDDIYDVDEFADRPYTVISISIPDRNGDMRTKSLRHCDDEKIPDKLVKLENLIREIASSAKRIKKPSRVEPEVKPVEKKITSSSKIDEAKKLMDRTQR